MQERQKGKCRHAALSGAQELPSKHMGWARGCGRDNEGDSTDPQDSVRDAGLREESGGRGEARRKGVGRERGSPVPRPLSPVTADRRAGLLLTTH